MRGSKSMKRKIAALLAAILIMPQMPVYAAKSMTAEENAAGTEESAPTEENVTRTTESVAAEENTATAESVAAAEEMAAMNAVEGEVVYNTGSCAVHVGYGNGDDVFDADGNYTIEITEENPFFPYEVQFTYDGETMNKWFMNPKDSVEVGGHTFYVSADFDGTELTQINLEVGGDTVPVYPAEKFADGLHLDSLQGLEKQSFEVSLEGYTPLELSMVKLGSLFAGEYKLASTDKVMLSVGGYYNDEYVIYNPDSTVDLSSGSGDRLSITAIVGEADQLARTNKKYNINCSVTIADGWLSAEAYSQNSKGNRTAFSRVESEWFSYRGTLAWFYLKISEKEYHSDEQVYISLRPDKDLFFNSQIQSVRVFEGSYESASSAVSEGKEITDKICSESIKMKDNGYMFAGSLKVITMIAYDAGNNVIGCKAMNVSLERLHNYVSVNSLRDKNGDYAGYVSQGASSEGIQNRIISLRSGYSTNESYMLDMSYYKEDVPSNKDVTAAYKGDYTSIKKAKAAGAKDIKDKLFADNKGNGGYAVNLKDGKNFTVFVGKDGSKEQEVYRFHIQVEKGKADGPSSAADLSFVGLHDGAGSEIPGYFVRSRDDSYSEYNYSTILVDEETDLSKVAPLFAVGDERAKVYAAGGSSPEVSGKSYHDFSSGPLQYTVSAEDGKASMNYWLHIVKAKSGSGELYVNSMSDPDSKTEWKDGVINTTREVLMDNYHDSKHEIFVANIGAENIKTISVQVDSNAVELDDYWTFTGKYDLLGFDAGELKEKKDGMQNLGKIVLKRKSGVENGTDVTGTLEIKSGSNTIMVMNLTGTVGDPTITTKKVPASVKYVPYGSMIQNSNKYSWNTVSYAIEGKLPDGMILKENGEIYGVPKKSGSYSFSVKMTNSYRGFAPSEKTYTLKVLSNSNKNVDGATDKGYDVTTRIKDIASDATGKQTFVSQGIYGEFAAVYLDGEKLKKGSDYTSKEGSTKLTLANQTLARSKKIGKHTIGVEFRTTDGDTLKRAAQNYNVKKNTSAKKPAASNGSTNTSANAQTNTTTNANTQKTPAKTTVSSAGNYTYTHNGTETVIKYVVQDGDSLWKIAKKFYGNGAEWWKIAADNKNTIKDPDKIKPGDILMIYVNR